MGRQVTANVSQSSEQWLSCAVRYLARWDRTAAQVEQFLRDKGASPVQVQRTINRLSELRYLNDHAYAVRWLDRRLARKPMGRERLKAELLATGVGEFVAEGAISEALRGVDEEVLARRALTIKRGGGSRLPLVKAVRLLRQRGFEEDTIDRMRGPHGGE